MALVLVLFPILGHASSFTFQTVDYPGQAWTALDGINGSGQIVGINWYAVPNGISFFADSQGNLGSSIQYPGAQSTAAHGIDNAGDVLGSFDMANPGSSTVGVFLRSSNGTYADLPLPPGLPSNAGPPANAISNNGAVVLSEYTNLYFFNGSTYTTVAVAGAGGALNAVTVGGIDDAGDVAGFYYALDGSTNSFIRYANGTFQPIYVPGSTYTEVLGMNDLGQVVGFYAEGNEQYGFIWTSSGITTLNVPGAVDTDPSGINDAGIIVGSYTDSTGGIHGFIADPTPEPASLAMMIACVVALLVTRGLHRRCARNRQV